MTPRVEFYKDRAGEWRWKLLGANGEQVAQGEGHGSENDARRAFDRIPEIASAAHERAALPER
jgi:uncharacterized protein YegP (UPF0339 family)